ncbi:aminoglycoside 6-adenylyltransferase [Anaerolinea thermophila]|uniref:Aminoglycoside 6-adenylyltransferase n=2 Tax=Anaerolinea TaxID=233189 RepID=E8N0I5_ANATU|nr:aminoglycoside 6-adenylyltransferase [Anaerolinea thermophila]BAJ64734.1 aminoglycoside 6-adenylyltransferase [Anaerolinea thermophila UNI-1]
MRTEQEMMDLILTFARNDERVRAVILNGSRANPNAPRDFFQDFDIVFVVTDDAPFKQDRSWMRCFGDLMIVQVPEEMGYPVEESSTDIYVYLMQFTDGNRIDLTIHPLQRLSELGRDSLSVLLLDKDGIIEPFPPPHEGDYLPKPPTPRQFADCCNEFWWVSTYVAKGLWREEITYAKAMMEVCRAQLFAILRWYIGMRTDFQVNPGKEGKYYRKYLEPERWARLLATYADADPRRTWNALFAMADLFRDTAQVVAQRFGLTYPQEEDSKVSAFLLQVRALPRTATSLEG